MPRVSIIIPVYNSERYIAKCLNSALGQAYGDFEIVIVDDGSTDNTRAIIQQYAERFPHKFTFVYQENKGPAAARNRALGMARGEFIAFLDADDLWRSDKLQKQIAILEDEPEVGFVYCDSDFIDAENKLIQNYYRKTKLLNGEILAELFRNHFIMTPAVVVRKSCLDQVGLFDETLRVGEDYDFFLRLASQCRTRAINEVLWSRRVITESLSRTNFVLDARNDLATLKRFIRLNRNFYVKNRMLVRERLAGYHFSFAYNCLEHGNNMAAFINLVLSMRYRPTGKAFKNILFCLVPLAMRKQLRNSRMVNYA